MQIIVCVDDNQGMMFNHRRVSKDRVLIEKIVEMARGRRLLVNTYSYELFKGMSGVYVDDEFLSNAHDDDICFVENETLIDFEGKIDKIHVFKWNRNYPADFYFDIALDKWHLVKHWDFKGYSHDKITEEVYER